MERCSNAGPDEILNGTGRKKRQGTFDERFRDGVIVAGLRKKRMFARRGPATKDAKKHKDLETSG